MSLYFRPISKEDRKAMIKGSFANVNHSPLGNLSDVTVSNNNTVTSTAIFGQTPAHAEDREFSYDDEFTRTGYIDLNEKIINPFLAGRDYKAWSILTGLQTSLIQDIVTYNRVYDKLAGCFYPVEEVKDFPYSTNRYLLGVDILLHLLHERDFADAIKVYINKNYLKALEKETGIEDIYDCITKIDENNIERFVEQDEESLPILHIRNGYFLDLQKIEDRFITEDGDIDWDLVEIFSQHSDRWQEDLYSESPEQFNELQLLETALNQGTERLVEDQVMDYLFVLPIGYRPEIKNSHNKLTTVYNDIVRFNSNVADVKRRTDNTIHSITRALRDLQHAIERLMVNTKDNKDKDYKSLAEGLKGKNGFIRDRLEGARIDYSGRTVITLDPTLPIDTIGVPIKILEKVAEPIVVREFVKKARKDENLHAHANMTDFHNQKDAGKYGISYIDFLKEVFSEKDIYGIIGRQPTLFYLGMQGFKIRAIEGNAIALSPLIVMPFNADFDGDQMHYSMPVTDEGLRDVKDKMLFKNNIWYPKNGEVTVVVRHEIQYGLWECLTRKPNGNSCSCTSREQVYKELCKGAIAIEDSYQGTTAGIAAFNYCVYGNAVANEVDLSKIMQKSKNVNGLMELNPKKLSKLLFQISGGKDNFLNTINKLVQLGFAISKFYPPNISVINGGNISEFIKKELDSFNKEMNEHRKFVEIGMELESNFNLHFSSRYSDLTKKIKKYILENLDESNGYWRMVVSGAKGNDNNLMQIYGIKGRVQKSDFEAFNTIIDGSYAGQLTGLEHFVTGYGSRKGISDKTLSTAKPGYMSRKLEHAGAPLRITCDDCSSGLSPEDVPAIEFYPEDIIPFIEAKSLSRRGMYPDDDPMTNAKEFYNDPTVELQHKKAIEYLADILVGRFCVTESNARMYIADSEVAKNVIREEWGNGYNARPVRMRSPMTCSNPCCKFCYGRDLAANTSAPKIGRKVGFIAAQAIGEPGTQLVMKNFQAGGIVGEANITSSFDLIEASFDLKDFSKDTTNSGIILYDPVSPVTGYIKKINTGQNKSQIYITKTKNVNDRKNLLKKKIFVDTRADLKSFVHRGDTMSFVLGNVNIRDLIRHDSYEKACKHILLSLYNTFKEQNVFSIHFECIIRNMMHYTVLAENGRYKPGDVISYTDINSISTSCPTIPTLIGVKYLPKYRQDFLQAFAMESQTTYVPRAIVSSRYDDLNDPIMKTALGLYLD